MRSSPDNLEGYKYKYRGKREQCPHTTMVDRAQQVIDPPQQHRNHQKRRYVPSSSAFLDEDAPGYSGSACSSSSTTHPLNPERQQEQEEQQGPICWKCRGGGGDGRGGSVGVCKVCGGSGRLKARPASVKPGTITRGRQGDLNNNVRLPDPAGYATPGGYGEMVRRATVDRVDVVGGGEESDPAPLWLPRQSEELCNLVGNWRILQRVGSHRWTTDDLVTAAVASKEMLLQKQHHLQHQQQQVHPIRYCDLGTGNASVLQMVLHQAIRHQIHIQTALGLEARSEAVGLARRSIAFNLGTTTTCNHQHSTDVSIVHTDFRSYETRQKFDFMTGTPPYFRVAFAVDTHSQKVSQATICQGGMPTSVQSAPARCEFRGGLEAYCQTACRLLKDDDNDDDDGCTTGGTLVLCENYQNHERALTAFVAAPTGTAPTLQDRRKAGPGHPVLCVRAAEEEARVVASSSCCSCYHISTDDVDSASSSTAATAAAADGVEVTEWAVRDEHGDWTADYARHVLDFMAIRH